MRGSQMKMMIKLHEAVNVPTLLYCAETWTLNKGDTDEIVRLELWTWKKTTPNAAVMYVTGAMYPSIRMQARMLVYLHRLLAKDEMNWAKVRIVFERMERLNIGWVRQIKSILTNWNLPTEWDVITNKTEND